MAEAALRGKKETLGLPQRSETNTRDAKGKEATEEGIFIRNYK